MRNRSVWLTLVLAPTFVHAQNAGIIAAQQANQQAMQSAQIANQQAMQATQQANQQAAQASQQAAQGAQASMRYACPATDRPKFSAKAGSYSSPVTVKIRDNTRGAVIYYTTDGWTPTADSTRYTGPVTIDSTTTLQAIAIAPGERRSRVAAAVYSVSVSTPGKSAEAAILVTSPDSSGKILIPHGTALPLLFTSDLNSKTADVGDKISLTLAEDVKAGDTVLIHKGAVATGVVTETDKSHVAGVPGEIIFKVDSMEQDGTIIRLRGSAAKEGQDKYSNSAAAIVPVVGPLALLEHGQEAEIKPGTPFTAYVDADTVLTPKN
jgi:hypothetical protein